MLSNVLTVHVFFVKTEKNVSLGHLCAAVANQSTDFPALGTRFCVQLLLYCGATELSSLNTMKTHASKLVETGDRAEPTVEKVVSLDTR